jgi:hypothetical protein
MDAQRDIQKSDAISRFFDKPLMRGGLSLNQSFERLYRRTERVVAGLFLATNHISATDPLRDVIRETGLGLLDDAIALRDEMRTLESGNISAFKASARYAVSLLRMLTVSGALSMQNSSVLIEAIDDLGNFLVLAQNTPLSETVSFTRQDFIESTPMALKDIKDTREVKDGKDVKDRNNMSDNSSKRVHNIRKQAVLEVLRSGGELGIADIAANLPEYSTKMIQRDLAELIDAGNVKKSGSKRWSRYSLAV